MVNLNEIGKDADDDGLFDDGKLRPKQRRVLEAVILHPHLSHKEIAEIADCHVSYPTKVLRKITKEDFEELQNEILRTNNIRATPSDGRLKDAEQISVVATIPMDIEVSMPKDELLDASQQLLRIARDDFRIADPEKTGETDGAYISAIGDGGQFTLDLDDER